MSDQPADKPGKGKQIRPRGSISEIAPGKYRVRICIGLNSATGKYDYTAESVITLAGQQSGFLFGSWDTPGHCASDLSLLPPLT